MIGLGLALMFMNPMVSGPLPKGFTVPIIALEFMKEVDDLKRFFDIVNQNDFRIKLMTANIWDYGFMVSYSLFAMLCGLLIFLETRVKAILLGVILSLLMLVGDAIENVYLGTIIQLEDFSGTSPLLQQLHFYTWVKWGSIGAIMMLYSIYFLQGNWWKKIMGFILLGTFGLTITAFILGAPWIELMSTAIFISFLCLFLFAVLFESPSMGGSQK